MWLAQQTFDFVLRVQDDGRLCHFALFLACRGGGGGACGILLSHSKVATEFELVLEARSSQHSLRVDDPGVWTLEIVRTRWLLLFCC